VIVKVDPFLRGPQTNDLVTAVNQIGLLRPPTTSHPPDQTGPPEDIPNEPRGR